MTNHGVVRPFAEQDRRAVVSLWRSVFSDDPPWNEPNAVIDTKLRVQPELFLVFAQHETVVGTVVAGFDGVRGWLHHVAVDPSHQGKGISRKLIAAAESRLQALGCVKLNLQVRAGNSVAAAKYQQMGFAEEPRISMGKLLQPHEIALADSHTKPTLHLMVGLPCAGKTTLARQLERSLPALRLNLDECHIQLYGQDADDPAHDARHQLVEKMLWDIAVRALHLGTNVILDYGLWAKSEREDYRERARKIGAASEIHFLDAAPEELLDRLKTRNSQAPADSFYISEDAMEPWIQLFQRPTPDELARRE